jgi:hypothetical protein
MQGHGQVMSVSLEIKWLTYPGKHKKLQPFRRAILEKTAFSF